MNAEEKLRLPEEFARVHKYPNSFVRLAIECGCPMDDGSMRFDEFVPWFLDYYAIIKERAGLPVLASTEGMSEEAAANINIGNMMLTYTEYLSSRSPSAFKARGPHQKASDSGKVGKN